MLPKNTKYANIIIDISHEKVDRPFQYKVPVSMQGKLAEGMKVFVPFGAGNKLRTGYIIELTNTNNFPEEKLKEIDSIDEKATTAEEKLMALSSYMVHRYGGTYIQSLMTVLPVKKKVKEKEKKVVSLLKSEAETREYIGSIQAVRYQGRRKLLLELLECEELSEELIVEKLGVSKSIIATLEKNGMVRVSTSRTYRGISVKEKGNREEKILSEHQRRVADELIREAEKESPVPCLLRGITGSGKTEVYMEVIDHVIKEGKQAIVLIPEIALTFQTLKRFYARFGSRVAIIHSKLSDGERYDQYELAKKGKVDIMIGPRSALFTPFPNLGVIVIDEEHEGSYKSEKMPKYHAVEVAEHIAKQEGALLLLGSATPSVNSYYKAQSGEYRLLELESRFGEATLPNASIVDMRKELKEGNKSPFSRKLKELLTDRLIKGEQSMLFINRRGYAGFVSCRDCGEVIKCPHCDVSLSQHGKADQTLVCHYCGYEETMPGNCPKCQSKKIFGMRAGTEQVEELLRKEYPSMRILRMDKDTTKSKDDYEKILSAFANGEADTLIGTQMIVKGHDFPNVTLAAAVLADLSLSMADYRASEKTFQLITQAAGRAGRGTKKGEVVIQTYQPENFALQYAAKQDYKAFYEEESAYRFLGAYPPVKHLLSLQFFGKKEELVIEAASYLKDQLLVAYEKERKENDLSFFGPAPAGVSKIRDEYRYGLYIKDSDLNLLIQIKDQAETFMKELKEKNNGAVILQFDFDPMNAF